VELLEMAMKNDMGNNMNNNKTNINTPSTSQYPELGNYNPNPRILQIPQINGWGMPVQQPRINNNK
jgi:hypothetical protein